MELQLYLAYCSGAPRKAPYYALRSHRVALKPHRTHAQTSGRNYPHSLRTAAPHASFPLLS